MAEADLSLVKDWVSLDVTPELYKEVRALWAYHCDRENELDIDALLTTLTEDCVYHLVNLGKKYHGHKGARQFYEELLYAFDDILWIPEVVVVGPQGVFDVVVMNGKIVREWADMKVTNERVSLRFLVWFPWDASAHKFSGELIYLQHVTPETALHPGEIAKGTDAHTILSQLAQKK